MVLVRGQPQAGVTGKCGRAGPGAGSKEPGNKETDMRLCRCRRV
jgi:hypothetical protein